MSTATKGLFGEAWLEKTPADTRHYSAIFLELLDRMEKMHVAGEHPDGKFIRTFFECGVETGFATEVEMGDLIHKIAKLTGWDFMGSETIPLWYQYGDGPEA